MPPMPCWYSGIDAVMDFATRIPLGGCGAWKHLPTSGNGQPAVACYLWKEEEGLFRAWSVNVLTLRGDRISVVTSFIGIEHFEAFGLPVSLP
jgi:RNA polymerase sigma-70 factor (ECF subfamily)